MLYPAIALGALGAAWLRSKTGEVAPLADSDLDAMGAAVCDAFEARPAFETPTAIAAAVGKAAYPRFAFPPLPLATRSHREAWAALELWAAELSAAARASNVSVCEWLKRTASAPSIEMKLAEVTLKPAEVLKPADVLKPAEVIPSGLQAAPLARPVPTPTPTPGRWYTIKSGDTLLGSSGVTSRAYNVPTDNQRRYQLSKVINTHPNNANLRFGAPENLYPAGRISFMPPFQTIYIPEA
jgi:hypothetical protein